MEEMEIVSLVVQILQLLTYVHKKCCEMILAWWQVHVSDLVFFLFPL